MPKKTENGEVSDVRTVGLEVKEKHEEVFEEKSEAAETETVELDVKKKPKGGKK